MKKNLLASLIIILVFLTTRTNAQCTFTPVVTPGSPILCPNSSDTLFTTEAYDAYQWYKGNNPIPGATLPYLVVNNPGDVGSRFSVLATLNGCSEQSSKVLVDGYVFLLPYTISTGDEGIYNPQLDAFINCPGDVHILQTSLPFTVNVQWYNNYKPIPGANSPELNLTGGKGSYTYSGSPDVCPDYTEFQPIPFNILFRDTVTITERNDTLFASRTNGRFRWTYNDREITGEKNYYLVPQRNGRYRVGVEDAFCTMASLPYLYNDALQKNISQLISFAPNPVHDALHIQIKSPDVAKLIISDLFGNRITEIAVHQNSLHIPLQQLHTGSYLLQVLNKNQQVIGSAQLFKE